MAKPRRPDVHELAAEIVRRALGSTGIPGRIYVVRLSSPPTPKEQLQLTAARLLRSPFAVMPAKCETVEDWTRRHFPRASAT
jgi:hypothetical protein